ncbi:hypothetical protein Psta_4169 [Pirellula staleyi DSM 6068]|uniref:Uncharacterized protein n=1 Tax=Pirellula staleyi (strain ATCC 27377 / DSM 6068 / ICPB 4128) TaxID=530564 RepID=D2R3W9_PIRSD|nr:hypothetical protein Psta_4169 [Pirellula staleyi DSM 6068]
MSFSAKATFGGMLSLEEPPHFGNRTKQVWLTRPGTGNLPYKSCQRCLKVENGG